MQQGNARRQPAFWVVPNQSIGEGVTVGRRSKLRFLYRCACHTLFTQKTGETVDRGALGIFFSVAERQALMALDGNLYDITRGFFSGWSRKEAYIKATELGISRGLDYFDVSIEPTAPASILADRRDENAMTRWEMTNIDVGDGYFAAIVATALLSAIRLYEAEPSTR
ncbi:MAG: 4'-phosphopantetheinyl transferase superfamily protein [Gemmatimonadaceae bacterium]